MLMKNATKVNQSTQVTILPSDSQVLTQILSFELFYTQQ